MAAEKPGADRLIAFLQSRDHAFDAFATGDSAREWLTAEGLIGSEDPVADEDARQARRLRAALLGILQDRTAALADPRTTALLITVCSAAPLRVVVEAGGVQLAATGAPVDAALAELLADLHRAEVAGELDRVKSCRACGWAFFDTSKNRSRVWCDMSRCGAQAKARAYRRRQAVS